MNRLLVIISSLVITCYLIWGRYNIFSDLEEQVTYAKNVYYSNVIDLDIKNSFNIDPGKYFDEFNTDKFIVLLECERTDVMNGEGFWKNKYSLKMRITAFAKTDNDIISNRLVQNFFYPTDEPMRDNDMLWNGWPDDKMEYPLGEVFVFPNEKIFMRIDVLVPDLFLNKANPRIKIVAKYDESLIGPYLYLKLFRDCGLLLSLICLGFLLINVKKRGSSGESVAKKSIENISPITSP